jgi:molybdopterin biosynthesis enzyme
MSTDFPQRINYQQALAIIREQVRARPLQTEQVPLSQAYHRVLAHGHGWFCGQA